MNEQDVVARYRERQEQIRKQRQPEVVDKPPQQKEDEESDIDPRRLAAAIGFETSIGLGTDVASSFLGLAPPLYALANFVSGAGANAIAQFIRGERGINLGEILSAGAVGIIPGSTIQTGKNVSRLVGKAGTIKRAAISGGFQAVGGEAIRIGIDEKRFLNAREALLGGVIGGTASSGLQKILNTSPKLLDTLGTQLARANPFTASGAGLGPKPPRKTRQTYVNRKPTLDRRDVEYVPTVKEIRDTMKVMGLDTSRAEFVHNVFKKDVKDIQDTKKMLNDYFYRNTPKNLQDLADAISAQEGVEYTVEDLSNILKSQGGAATTRIVKGMPTSNKRIRNMVDLQRILLDRLRKLKQQPTFNKGHANSIGQILKKSNVAVGADRPDNIFIEEARSIYSRDAQGNIKLEKVGNISKKDLGDDPLVIQRLKGFSPTLQESILKVLNKSDEDIRRLYAKLGIDASDLEITENIDLSTAVRSELRDWTEETADDLVKSGVDPEKAADYLLDINEELGDIMSAAGIYNDMMLLFQREPGLAAQFLSELIGKKKRGPGKLANIPISSFERQMLKVIKDYFKQNPVMKFKDIAKVQQKNYSIPKPGEVREARKILKKKIDRGNL